MILQITQYNHHSDLDISVKHPSETRPYANSNPSELATANKIRSLSLAKEEYGGNTS